MKFHLFKSVWEGFTKTVLKGHLYSLYIVQLKRETGQDLYYGAAFFARFFPIFKSSLFFDFFFEIWCLILTLYISILLSFCFLEVGVIPLTVFYVRRCVRVSYDG